MRRAVTIGDVGDAAAVRRPLHLRFAGTGGSNTSCIAAILRGRCEHFAAHHERDLLSVGRERELPELAGEREMFDSGAGRRAAQRDGQRACRARRWVYAPDLHVALEHDSASVCRDSGPEHSPIREARELPGGAFRRTHPDILRAGAVRHEIESTAVRAPHRPGRLGSAFGDALVARRGAVLCKPDLALIEVAVPLAPPLPRSDAARRESDRATIGRGRGPVFAGVSVGAHRHGSASLERDPIDVVHPGDVVARG